MKVNTLLALALGLGIACAPAYSQTFETTTHSTEVVNPPRVLDSWMQPTGFKTTEVLDQSGEPKLLQEPMVWERHERVAVPVVHNESTTVFSQSPKQVIQRSVSSQSKVSSTFRPRKRVASLRRRSAVRVAAAPRRRTVAVKSSVNNTSTTTQTQSMTVMQRNERSIEQPVVIERRDPALDLY